jgi:hypothetical protein
VITIAVGVPRNLNAMSVLPVARSIDVKVPSALLAGHQLGSESDCGPCSATISRSVARVSPGSGGVTLIRP